MGHELLTIKEIARRLDVPESNIRYYRDRFDDFLPSVGEGRKRRYLPEALDVFRFIVERYKEDRSTDEVGQELMQHFPRQARIESNRPGEHLPAFSKDDERTGDPYALLQRQARVMERLSELLVARDESGNDFNRLRRDQAKLKKAFLLLWKNHKKSRLQAGQPNPSGNGSLEAVLTALRSELDRLEQEQRDFESRVWSELDQLKQQMRLCLERMDGQPASSDSEA